MSPMAASGDRLLLHDMEPGSSRRRTSDTDAQSLSTATTVKSHPSGQTREVILKQTGQLACTAVLVVIEIIIIKVYSSLGNVNQHKKYEFNAIITATTILLSLNFFEAFKSTVKILRWRFLATRRSTVREVDLILRSESLIDIGTLMVRSFRKPLLFLTCLTWILINLIAQSVLAASSLTFSWETGTDSTGTVLSPGSVEAPKLDCYYNDNGCPQFGQDATPPGTNQTLAHAYGETASARTACAYASDSDIIGAPQNCFLFNNTDGEFAYRYREFNPLDSGRTFPYLTSRIIKASAGQCFEYGVNPPILTDSPEGKEDTWMYVFGNATYNGTLWIPRIYTASDSTTYVYNGTSVPATDNEQSCGSRCRILYAYRGDGNTPARPSNIFACPITITPVSNSSDPQHDVPDVIARVAAVSVALNGRWRGPVEAADWRSWQMYSFGSHWETQNLTAQEVGARMAEFAMASLATMAALNPLQILPGTLPQLGYNLAVHWPYIIAFAAGVVAVHAAMILATALLVSRGGVVVCDNSFLIIAQLLHGLRVGPLWWSTDGADSDDDAHGRMKRKKRNDRPTTTNGKEAAEVLQARLDREAGGKSVRLRYGLGQHHDDEKPVLKIGKS